MLKVVPSTWSKAEYNQRFEEGWKKDMPRFDSCLQKSNIFYLAIFIRKYEKFIGVLIFVLLYFAVAHGVAYEGSPILSNLFFFCALILIAIMLRLRLYWGSVEVKQLLWCLRTETFRFLLNALPVTGKVLTPSPYEVVDYKESQSTTFWTLSLRSQVRTLPVLESALNQLRKSELLVSGYESIVIQDVASMFYRKSNMTVVTFEALKSDTNNASVLKLLSKPVFRGYFVSVELVKPLTGKTFITTEGDTTGFSNASYITNLLGMSTMVTELEWNEFEKLLRVVSTDPSEARYILSPDLMEDLYDWWKEKHNAIRISFIGSVMYILFQDNNISILDVAPTLKEGDLKRYAEYIASSQHHILHLIDNVCV